MNGSSNPYQAPRALFTADDNVAMPPAMLVTMVCCLAHHAPEIIPLYGTPIAKFELFTPTVIVLGIYGVAMCVALWRRQQWARVWLVLTTVLAVFLLGRLLWRGVSIAQWHAVVGAILRIAVGPLLFLPSVRRWFAPRCT